MSTDTEPPESTRDAVRDAAALRAAADDIDSVARAHGGVVDSALRDAQQILTTVATVVEEEDGEITVGELQRRVYPTGGSR